MSDYREPVAWLVDGGEYQYVSLFRESADAAADEEGGTVIPLYRSPTLTDAEREAVARAAKFADDAAGYCKHADNAELARKNAAILRGLLERTSDGATTASDATKETGKRAGSTRLG